LNILNNNKIPICDTMWLSHHPAVVCLYPVCFQGVGLRRFLHCYDNFTAEILLYPMLDVNIIFQLIS